MFLFVCLELFFNTCGEFSHIFVAWCRNIRAFPNWITFWEVSKKLANFSYQKSPNFLSYWIEFFSFWEILFSKRPCWSYTSTLVGKMSAHLEGHQFLVSFYMCHFSRAKYDFSFYESSNQQVIQHFVLKMIIR